MEPLYACPHYRSTEKPSYYNVGIMPAKAKSLITGTLSFYRYNSILRVRRRQNFRYYTSE